MFARRAHLPYSLLCCLLAALLAPVLFSASAHAASSGSSTITITSQTDTVNFPKSIAFQMSAQDSSALINTAMIFIRYGYNGVASYLTQHTETVPIKAGHTITANWVENTTGDNFSPPGTLVTYYWLLYDNAGHSYEGAQQQFRTIDTRFPWQHLTQGLLQVNWYNRPLDFGQTVLSEASSDITRISHTLGGGLKAPINLWVYQTDEDFHGSLAPNTYEWVGGIALPPLNEAEIVVMDSGDTTLVRDMPHELTHLVFHQLIGAEAYAPTWFDEGLAVYNQQYHEPAMTNSLQDALNTHSLLPLDSISRGFPANADQAYLAYAESWNLISYMYSTFGQPDMVKLITLMSNQSNDFDTDLKLSIGMDQDHLENQWHLSLHQPPTLSPAELTPTAQPVASPHPVQVTINDNSSSLLIIIGLVLILVPLCGIAFLFVYQRRSQQKALAFRQAQQIIAANWQLAQPPQPSQPSLSPYRPHAAQNVTPGMQTPPSSSSRQEWVPGYPGLREGTGNGNGLNQIQPYLPGQEYLSQPPQKQAPQE
ncbi:MAG TPA: peptidase MA family metallohydrolase [Ktedonobacteraceae bacterium]|nr:peptidase MA family metallohydrolase [Ktedonobacteraceae bacterium]